MDVTIPCETFVRLSSIPRLIPDSDVFNQFLRCVYIENHDGKSFAVATNRKMAAIVFLGETDQPDGFIHVSIATPLVQQCEAERPFNSKLTVTVIDGLPYGTAKTTLGFSYGPAAIFPPEGQRMRGWREWFPEKMPTKTHGAFYTRAEIFTWLAHAMPSSNVIFPEYIDNRVPVLIRDSLDPNWCGLIMPSSKDEKTGQVATYKGATIPEWFKA